MRKVSLWHLGSIREKDKENQKIMLRRFYCKTREGLADGLKIYLNSKEWNFLSDKTRIPVIFDYAKYKMKK
ncbi:hypothetical protein CI610_02152 [invertebrate metagenome]|uniref:Uncharacterized protein n=1 Tax=invertebrate metagenome TaxID=1711999 RepID=A0A2H9T6Q8_9ZZZZ